MVAPEQEPGWDEETVAGTRTQLTVRCAPGLRLPGGADQATILCEAGAWRSSHLRCTAPSCPAPPAVEAATVELSGGRALYSCPSPGTVLWGGALACQEGRWVGRWALHLLA